MYNYGRGIRFFCSAARSGKTSWDPVLSLELNHPSLVLLEKSNSRDQFKQILGQIMRNNLIGQTFPMSRLVYFSAVSYPENMDLALILFSHYTPSPNLFIYNTMISALSLSSNQSFTIFNMMLRSRIYPDKHTLIYLLNASKYVLEVKQVHCYSIITGLLSNGYLQNTLIRSYVENGMVGLANCVFEEMPTPDVVSFNILIVDYAKRGSSTESLRLFHEMVGRGLQPDEYTMLGLLISCGHCGYLRLGNAVHAWLQRRKHFISNLILDNALLDMYVKCQQLELAYRAFCQLKEKDAISWNTMIAGFAKGGDLELAEILFNQMPSWDLVSYNSLISGCVSVGKFAKVRELFEDIMIENIKPDNVTMVSLASAAAEIGALNIGRCVHGLIIRMLKEVTAFLGSALIDMYCKCGSIDRASLVFSQVAEKDVTIWTTMITGLAFHGYGNKALKLFSAMQEHLILPNAVTFASILTACSHSGLIDEGLKIFNYMKHFNIQPGIEHYGCLVDLLARSGRLTEAKHVIETMPLKPSRSIWGSILNACRAQGDKEMAETALTELLKLEPAEEGGYMLLSNIYAASGQWKSSKQVRELMVSRGVKKTAGCSSVVVDGAVHNFVAADKLHPRLMEVRSMLNSLRSEMILGSDF